MLEIFQDVPRLIRSTFPISLILFFTLVLIPFGGYRFHHELLFVVTTSFSLIGWVYLLKKHRIEIQFEVIDVFWLLFITWCVASISWSRSYFLAIHGCVTWAMVYSFYKLIRTGIQAQVWTIRDLQELIRSILILNVLIFIAFAAFKGVPDGRDLVFFFGSNDNYVMTLMASLIPVINFEREHKNRNIINLAVLCLAGLIIFSSSSQTSKALYMLAVVFVILSSPVLNAFQKKMITGGSIILAILMVFILIQYDIGRFREFDSFFHLLEKSEYGNRVELWKYSLQFLEGKLWHGVGFNNWITEIYQFGYSNYTTLDSQFGFRVYHHPHSLYLSILSEIGLIGLALFFGTIFHFFHRVALCVRKGNLPEWSVLIVLSFLLSSLLFGVAYFRSAGFSALHILFTVSIACILPSKFKIDRFHLIKYTVLLFSLLSFLWMVFNFAVNSRYEYIDKRDKKIHELEKIYRSGIKSQFRLNSIAIKLVESELVSEDDKNTYFEMLLQEHPYRVEYLYLYAKHLMNTDRTAQARVLAKECLKLTGDHYDIFLLLAEIELKAKRFKLALDYLEFEDKVKKRASALERSGHNNRRLVEYQRYAQAIHDMKKKIIQARRDRRSHTLKRSGTPPVKE